MYKSRQGGWKENELDNGGKSGTAAIFFCDFFTASKPVAEMQ